MDDEHASPYTMKITISSEDSDLSYVVIAPFDTRAALDDIAKWVEDFVALLEADTQQQATKRKPYVH